MMVPLIIRDLRRSYGGGQVWLPVIFYLSVAVLFPFAVGPDRGLLNATGGGILWIAALLATLLPIDRLLRPDIDSGMLDALLLGGWSEEYWLLAKLIGHWLGFAPPLMFAGALACLLMGLPSDKIGVLLGGLAIASIGLASLALLVAALTAGLRGSGAIVGLLLVPLAIPMLIFGAGALRPGGEGGLLLLGAASLFLTAIIPFAAAAALRSLRE